MKNQSLDLCKLIASVLVVFLHVPFPGEFGGIMGCFARVAVPMFFAISGWFSFQAGADRLAKRFWRIILLEAAGVLLYGGSSCLLTGYYGGSWLDCLHTLMLSREQLLQWVLLNVDPYSGHLWYLSAAALCYGILWIYVRLFGCRYRGLYLLAGCLLAGHWAMAEFSGFLGISVHYYVYRNGWLFGLPMFTLGLGLRQYWEGPRARLNWKDRNLVLLLILGLAVSLWERNRFGGYDLPVGTVLAVGALLLLTASHPEVPGWLKPSAAWFGPMSTGVYLVHLLILDLYQDFLQGRVTEHMGTWEPWVRPLLVAAAALLLAYLWQWLKNDRRSSQ